MLKQLDERSQQIRYIMNFAKTNQPAESSKRIRLNFYLWKSKPYLNEVCSCSEKFILDKLINLSKNICFVKCFLVL